MTAMTGRRLAGVVGRVGLLALLLAGLVAVSFDLITLVQYGRSRYDQEQAVQAFGVELRDEVDVDRLLGHVRSAVTAAVEPTTITIWRREPWTQR